MISLHFAVATDGGFGYQGKLPWGSFPEELEVFFGSIRPDRHILVGEGTWSSLPLSAKERLQDIIKDTGAVVQVVSSKDAIVNASKEEVNGISDYQCIGGAFVLGTIINDMPELVDAVHFSLIDGVYPSDVTLTSIDPLGKYLRTSTQFRIVGEKLSATHFILTKVA